MQLINRLLWFCLLAVLLSGCAEKKLDQDKPADAAMAAYRQKLLDDAFGFASAIPLEPHIKDRARSQGEVVAAALEMDQPTRALHVAEQIPNWRNGKALADYVCYSIDHGVSFGLEVLLEEADRAARFEEQEWRQELVWVRIAHAWKKMGRPDKAAEYIASVNQTETGAAELQNLEFCTEDEFKQYAEQLDDQLTVGVLDLKKSALFTYAALYGRFFEDQDRRQSIEEKIISGWDKLPYFDRIDLLKMLCTSALKHGDQQTASRLADRAGTIVNDRVWPIEYHVQALGKLAKLRIECGQDEMAQADLQKALDLFSAKKEEIINIYRAEALLPIAEAHALADRLQASEKIYALAVEEAVVNSNSRPRAEDLCLIQLSMARYGVEPSAPLWTRMSKIRSGLGEPW